MANNISDLDQRITIQAESRTPDASGGYTPGWTDLATVWAAIAPLNAGEKWQAGQLGEISSYRITIRPRSDIDAAQRIVWNSLTLNIRAVTQRADKSFTDIIATKGDAV